MKKLFQKSLALLVMLMLSVSMWGAIDWSGIGWVGNGAGGDYTNKYKVSADAGPNVVNIQHPGFATADGMYITFPDAAFGEIRANGAQLSYDVQGAGICLHMSNFTAKETEVQVMNSENTAVRWTINVYFEDGTESAPVSKFCSTPADNITANNGSCSPLFTINTLDNGNVEIKLSAGEGTDGETKFRNTGMNGTFKLGGSADDFTAYFNKAKTDDYTYMLTLKDAANKPANGAIISFDGQIEARSNLHTDDWSNYQLNDYVYGSKCPTDVAVTGVTLDNSTASVPVNKTLTLKATIAPANAANKNIIWTSSAEAVATVADGVVTPVATGETTITAKTEDGNFTATCVVTVTAAKAVAPSALPTAPAYASANVKAVHSATYGVESNYGAWGGSQSFTKETYGIKIVMNAGNGYCGLVDFPAIDANTMEYLHADIWIEDNASLRLVPIVTGQGEHGVSVNLEGGKWNAIDLALNEGAFASYTDWTNVYQMKIDLAAGLTFWINNVYFYTTSTADVTKPEMTSASLAAVSYTSASINVAATDDRGVTKYIVKNGDTEVGKFIATDGKINVTGLSDATAYTLSVYAQDAAENVSDNKVDVALTTLTMPAAPTAPDVTTKDYRSVYAPSLTNMLAHDFVLKNWGSADGVKVDEKGYFFYHTTSNATVVWGENSAGGNAIVATDTYKGSKGGLDASTMEYMHVDIWADKAGCNSMVVVIDDRAYNAAQTLNAGWNSFDLPMSDFAWTANPADYNSDNVAWIKFVGLNNTNDVAVTNVYFWVSTSTTKAVTATKNIEAAGTAVVKQNDVVVTEAENGSDVHFVATENDGYLFLGWYDGSTLKSTDKDYTVTVDGATTLQAKFRALNTIYCHTQLTSGDKSIYLTMKRTAENTYQVVIDSETEMQGFSNAYIGGVSGAAGEQIKLNDADIKAQYVTLSENKHRITINVPSTKAIKWNTPVYINMPGEVAFTEPQNKTIEYDVTCDEVAVSSVTLNQSAATVDVDGNVTLVPSIAPIYADNQTITWTSSDEAVATVANGVVTGIAEGNATITATAGGKQATCAITVQLDPTVPHVAAPTVDATGKEIRAIYSDDVTPVIAHDFGFNPWGGATATREVTQGNNFILFNTASSNGATIGMNDGGANAIVALDGYNDGTNTGVDASAMKYLHMDVFSSVAVSNFTPQLGDHALAAQSLNGNGWQSLDIELQAGDLTDAANVRFMKFNNMPSASKIAIDNIYFWKSNGTVAVESVSLNKTATTIDKDQHETLVATIAPMAANQNVTWSSNNTAVATVDATGKVTAVAEGTAVITATSEADATKTASCTVTVVAPTTKTWYGYAEKNDIGFEYALTYNLDKTVTIVITRYGNKTGIVNPSFSIDGEWKDCTKDGDVFTRTTTKTFEMGVTYDCFIQNNYAGGQSDPHFNYTIGAENTKPAIEVTGMSINHETLELAIGEVYTDLSATVRPMAATDKSFTWASSNEAVATVTAEGVVTAVAAGTANITATSTNGKVATCVVTVLAAIEPATAWGEGTSKEIELIYSITRNADRTLTYVIEATHNKEGFTMQVNDGDYHPINLENGLYTYTSTATYVDGATVSGFFYMPFDGDAGRVDFSYTVGSENYLMKTARTLTSSNIGTICMPKAVKAFEGATFYEIAYVEMGADSKPYKVFFDEVTELEAGHAYIFEPEESATEIKLAYTFDIPAAAPVPVNGLHGTFTDIADGDAGAAGNILEGNYIINTNMIRLCTGNCSLPANRAYIVMSEVSGYPVAPAPGRKRIALSGQGTQTTTGLDNLQGETELGEPQKILRDGKLFILRGGKIYNAAGQMVK